MMFNVLPNNITHIPVDVSDIPSVNWRKQLNNATNSTEASIVKKYGRTNGSISAGCPM